MYVNNAETRALLRAAWYSKVHAGANKPFFRVWARTGRLRRRFVDARSINTKVYSLIPGVTQGHRIWHGFWTPSTSWREVPSIEEITLETDFSENGVTRATFQMTNEAMVEEVGIAGLYHLLQRGYYAPFRGFQPKSRPPIAEKNAWYDFLNDKSTEIVVVMGYGEVGIPVFKGLINDLAGSSAPDKLTLIARDHGQYLTDQNVFVNAKTRSVRDPITFADRRRTLEAPGETPKYLLVDDAADIVKTVFQWCGFQNWEVESTGVRLSDKLVFNRSDKLINIVNKVAELTNYVFFMKPPDVFDPDDLDKSNEANLSMGVPVFRSNQAMRKPNQTQEPVEEVREDTLLTGIEFDLTDEPLAYNIRVRGKESRHGVTLYSDRTKRFMYMYRPVWSRDTEDRNGNVKKYVVHHDEQLASVRECKVAALFIAFREALESAKATVEFPALPWIYLDQQVSIKDTGTGLSTRIWTTNRSLSIRTGESPHFKSAIGGSLLDTPDITETREELREVLAR